MNDFDGRALSLNSRIRESQQKAVVDFFIGELLKVAVKSPSSYPKTVESGIEVSKQLPENC